MELVEGSETARLREKYNAKKARDKRERSINSHAIDALVIAANEIGLKKTKSTLILRLETVSISEKATS